MRAHVVWLLVALGGTACARPAAPTPQLPRATVASVSLSAATVLAGAAGSKEAPSGEDDTVARAPAGPEPTLSPEELHRARIAIARQQLVEINRAKKRIAEQEEFWRALYRERERASARARHGARTAP